MAMKTVRINQKLNFLFFLLMLMVGMICIGTIAFGQTTLAQDTTYKTPQSYGDSCLADLELQMIKGKLVVKVIVDNDLYELVSVDYHGGDGKMPDVETFNDFKDTESVDIKMPEFSKLFIKTSRGISTLTYYVWKKRKAGFVLMNGKLIAMTRGKIITDQLVIDPDYFKDLDIGSYNPIY